MSNNPRKNNKHKHVLLTKLLVVVQDHDQDSLLVKRRNDNHSPGPVIRELVPSSHQGSELDSEAEHPCLKFLCINGSQFCQYLPILLQTSNIIRLRPRL